MTVGDVYICIKKYHRLVNVGDKVEINDIDDTDVYLKIADDSNIFIHKNRFTECYTTLKERRTSIIDQIN